MKVNEPRIIVCCPRGETGGPELLHQLVHELRGMGRDARVAYFPFEEHIDRPASYDIYDAPKGSLSDDEETFVLVPETATYLLRRLNKAATGVWWLSFDYYFGYAGKSKVGDFLRSCLGRVQSHRVPLREMRRIRHFAQSHYAQASLKRYGIEATLLTDYLRPDFTAPAPTPSVAKENLVAFNPRKGLHITERIIKANPDITFVAIQGLTPPATFDLLRRAKMYIDFGHHPGKDRLPREAAMAGCCVVTGLRGAARFDADLPIPPRYKISGGTRDMVRAFRPIADDIFSNFDENARHFALYRRQIREERAEFRTQVREIFL